MAPTRKESLNYEVVFNNIVNGLADYLTNNNIKCQVLGLSGGLDSTVSAAICKKVFEKTGIPLIGVSLPCSTNKGDEISSASMAGGEFCNEFTENNVEDVFTVIERACKQISGVDSTPISQGNIKARLRMITLFDIASKKSGIVIGTSNLTEWWTGFWTLNGDVGNLNPIGELWKTEVYALAQWMLDNVYKDSMALKAAIEITPTDGNGVKDGGDAAQIMPGYTYNEIDHVLSTWVGLSSNIRSKYGSDGMTDSTKNTVFDVENEDAKQRRIELCKKSGKEFIPTLGDMYGVDSVRKVCMRSWNSEFKRKNLEMCIDINNGGVLMH